MFMKSKVSIITLVFALILTGCPRGTDSQMFVGKNASRVTASSSDAVAETVTGKVAGYIENGLIIFKGIPYATAQRFELPQHPESWEGIRSCRAYGPVCPQAIRTGWQGDEQAFAFNWDDGFPGEDCQRLNIWTPGLKDGKKRPVMVWLHGGGYSAGSGQELPAYDGASLTLTGDVVVVTLNHRLNILGFLDLSAFGEKYAMTGNLGIMDIIMALEWVRDNIANFGGDSQNVTLFGQSGGGGKVSTLLATPRASGLFHKAIVQSGSMISAMDPEYSRKIGIEVVRQLGLKPSQVEKLKDIPYRALSEAGENAVAKVKKEAEADGLQSLIFGWAPTTDGIFLPEQPFDREAPEAAKDIPMIIGTTLHEFSASTYIPDLRNIDLQKAREILKEKYGDKTDSFIESVAAAYPGFRPADLFDIDTRFRQGALHQAEVKVRQKGAPVYMYLFSWESPMLDGALRAMHCMELPFVFNNIHRSRHMTGGSEEASRLAEKMSRAWINFARSGNPNVASLPEWDPYDPGTGATMIFDNQCRMEYHHDRELISFILEMNKKSIEQLSN
jgi:para-nitrobenzyl esterase